MSLQKSIYDFAYKLRQQPLGNFLANTWHRCAPSITVRRKIYGVDVCMDLRDSLYWWGVAPERIEAIEGFEKLLTGVKGNVWDVGCNVGIFSLYAASLGNKVTAFDLSPKAISLLQKSAKVNGFNIATVSRAFSTTQFKYTPPKDADTRNQATAQTAEGEGEMSMTFLEAEAKFGRPDFIKLDVEHHETVFLKSQEFREWIKTNRIPLIVELHEMSYWDLVWPDVPYVRFDDHHPFFNPPPAKS